MKPEERIVNGNCMKAKKIIFIAIFFPLISMSVNAEVFLSRNLCSIDFDSLVLYKGNNKYEMFAEEINTVISRVREATEVDCLQDARVSAVDKISKRQNPKKESCSLLPNEFYADKNGYVLYRMSDRKMERSNDMLDDIRLGDCLDPMLDY